VYLADTHVIAMKEVGRMGIIHRDMRMPAMQNALVLQAGHARIFGAHVEENGVNFALAAPNATAVDLCLFDSLGNTETHRLQMPQSTHGIWHGCLLGAKPGLVYGWRVYGPWAPERGHRFNPAKLLLDPYAREVVGRYGGQDIHVGHHIDNPGNPDGRDNAALALKAKVVEDLPTASVLGQVDPGKRIIYEMHVKGFTELHPGVPPELRGTYAGLGHSAAIAHLCALGVTTVSLMPVAYRADEARLVNAGLTNYWGYNPIAWSAPEVRYWSGVAGSSPRSEFRSMVDSLHAAGLEVLLDVVYNHSAETDELGPTLSLRGIDNSVYYHLDPVNPARYANWTGCGNCLNLQHPLVLRMVMDSLRNWVSEFGVDGFRFDLASELARGGRTTQYAFDAQASFLAAVAQDPMLRERVMVAEPWDIGPGGYQLGGFPPQWLEWNDRFRDVQRGVWLHQKGTRGMFAQRLSGSVDIFPHRERAPYCSVNYVAAHDGFTLTDMVSYVQRHNLANGEGNRDGHGENLSVNNGVEGPSQDQDVIEMRSRQKRVLLACVLLSVGTPMLLAGDEIGHTQGGNNNAYCQNNRTTWLDWGAADMNLLAFVRELVALRQNVGLLQAHCWWQTQEGELGSRTGHRKTAGSGPVAHWFNEDAKTLTTEEWNDSKNLAFALTLVSRRRQLGTDKEPATCLVLFNPGEHSVTFQLPPGDWHCRLKTCEETQKDVPLGTSETLLPCSLWLATQAP
jgi:glycogen operon protein